MFFSPILSLDSRFLEHFRSRSRLSKNEKFRLPFQAFHSTGFQRLDNCVDEIILSPRRGFISIEAHSADELRVLGIELEGATKKAANERRLFGGEEQEGVGAGVESVAENGSTYVSVDGMDCREKRRKEENKRWLNS